MSYFRAKCYGLAWLATVGMCLPPSVVSGNDAAADAMAAVPAIHDVALAPGGLLLGRVLNTALRPVANTPVAIHANGQAVASAVTDSEGVFAVAGLRGGMHQVVSCNEVENCRFWAPDTGPPHAVKQLRFVPGQQTIVRGQWGPPPSHQSMVDRMKMWATNPWVIGGVVATAIAVPVVLHNLDDDDDNGS